MKCIHRWRLARRCHSPGLDWPGAGPLGPGASGVAVTARHHLLGRSACVQIRRGGHCSPLPVSSPERRHIDTQDNRTAPQSAAQVRLRSRASAVLVRNGQRPGCLWELRPLWRVPRAHSFLRPGSSVGDNRGEDHSMASESGAVQRSPSVFRGDGQGSEKRRDRLPLEHRHRRRLDSARLLARRDARLHRRRQGSRRPRAGGAARRIHSDAARRLRLQILQPRRSRRGHDVRLGHAHVRSARQAG